MSGTKNPENAFALIVRAAIEGRACPHSHGANAEISSDAITALAAAGRIRSEISGRNWRQVFILAGQHAGKATAPNPNNGHRVWRVTDGDGTRTDTSVQRRVAKAGPLPELQRKTA